MYQFFKKNLGSFSAKAAFVIIGFTNFAVPVSGAVLDRDDELKIITMHPTPTVDLQVIGAGEGGQDGAPLLVSLEYQSKYVASEIEALKDQNPGYEVKVVRADTEAPTATLGLPDLRVEFQIPVRASQIGLFVNTSVWLSAAQVRYLQKLGGKASQAFTLVFPSTSSFLTTRIVESYKSDPQLCSRIAGNNVRSVMRGILDFPKPREIRNLQTFDDLKRQIIDRCFVLSASQNAVSSWSGLLDVAVERAKSGESLTALFTQKTNVQKRHTITPAMTLTIN